MQVKQIEIFKLRIKLRNPFIISLGSFAYAENIVVLIRTDNGINGFGECSPFLSIHGESIDTCFIVGQYLGKNLLKRDPLNIPEWSSAMDKVIYGNSSIKSAFDMALYDICSQNAGIPLYSFLGGKNNKTLVTDYTVSLDAPEKMALEAVKIKERGFQKIKVKLGESAEKDIERIQLIREAVGKSIPLRIDANQGWNSEEAIQILKSLNKFDIEYCEEPIPRWNFIDLSRIRKNSPIPIMADESCCDHHDVERLINLKACDYFNIKLGKSSGIFKALQMLRLAEKEKIKLQVGGFLESRLGFTASAHLALAGKNEIQCDFDTPLMFSEDPVEGGIIYNEKGVIAVPEVPGLGAKIDKKYLSGLESVMIK